jgi:hypothetical protein
MDFLGKLKKKNLLGNVLKKGNQAATSNSTTSNSGALGRFIFMDFCQPAKFYLVIALLTLIYYVSTDQSFIWIVLKAVLFIFWGFLLNKICTMDFTAIAWLMAIVPQCIFIFFTLKVSPATPNAPKTSAPSYA